LPLGLASIATKIDGMIVVSQSCDIVKECTKWNFVQIAALQRVDDESFLSSIRKGERPNFAFVPGLEAQRLVANLDLIMTVEKSVLAGVPKEAIFRGVRNDVEILAFAECLSRKFSRFAFPDNFNEAVRKIQERIREKHPRDGADGRAFQALREIRAIAIPSWQDQNPEVELLFIVNSDVNVTKDISEAVERLVSRFVPQQSSGRLDIESRHWKQCLPRCTA
jgi:hypothetical protein